MLVNKLPDGPQVRTKLKTPVPLYCLSKQAINTCLFFLPSSLLSFSSLFLFSPPLLGLGSLASLLGVNCGLPL